MTNREKFKDEPDEMLSAFLAVVEGKPVHCEDMDCQECDFRGKCPVREKCVIDWLNAEYQGPPVDWSKVPIDTPVMVRNMMKKINVVLEAYIQTGECTYTNVFKTVPIEVPDDGIDWHVAGEEKTNQRTS